MSDEWQNVAAVDQIGDGQCIVVDIDDQDIAVYNLGGEFFAIEDQCTHDGGELAGGPIENGCAVCPRHGAKFDIRTGKVMAPPAYEDVHAFPVQITNGQVQLRDDRI
ncbi:Rieske (2Fe-2S) protein [Salinisphaera orenii]|uniref:Rieske (2Fe-2S) protein n=1 Tax=Salinisphaera orenii TaxID=856731 RepID=UPI000DBE82D5